MTVYDCCIIHSELDMLELRLNILRGMVDYHVIVEAGQTHSGNRKPAPVGDALQTRRFAEFADKMIYVYADTLDGDNSWAREHYHRGLIGKVLESMAEPDDLIIVADVDEIPSPEAIRQVGAHGAALELDFYYYSFQHRVQMGWGIGALHWRDEHDANKIRTLAGHDVPHLPDAGFHASFFMTPEQVIEKLNAYMHATDIAANVPRDPAWLKAKMDAGEDIFERGLVIERVEGDEHLPPYVREHRARYEALGWFEAERVTT